MVIVVEGYIEVEQEVNYQEVINSLLEKGYSKRDAIKEVSDRYNVSKNKLYNEYKED